MRLVDYSSEAEEDEHAQDAPKAEETTPHPTALPPLPREFLDLYASTVRPAASDDPSLHQGRQRSIPHVAGQWPSHIYIEWFPSAADHARLSALVASLQDALGGETRDDKIHSFLTSDLSAHLPLHISLSRPFVLTTAAKGDFLTQLVDAVATSGVGPFDVAFADLNWYRGTGSRRAFLVLRAVATDAGGADDPDDPNRPLVALLERCNEQVMAAGQPPLYAGRRSSIASDTTTKSDRSDASNGGAASAFHVSVAWTLAPSMQAWDHATHEVYEQWKKDHADEPPLRIHVDSIKAKIGNVVTDIPLPTTAARGPRRRSVKRARSSSSPAAGDDSDHHHGKKNLFGL